VVAIADERHAGHTVGVVAAAVSGDRFVVPRLGST
jgi:hypothetical protein